MNNKYKSLINNETQDVVDKGTIISPLLSSKQVFTIKRGINSQIKRFKVRQVVRGFEQREGINYSETFAAVVKVLSYRILFALLAKFGQYVY